MVEGLLSTGPTPSSLYQSRKAPILFNVVTSFNLSRAHPDHLLLDQGLVEQHAIPPGPKDHKMVRKWGDSLPLPYQRVPLPGHQVSPNFGQVVTQGSSLVTDCQPSYLARTVET